LIPFRRTQNAPDCSTGSKSDLPAISIPKTERAGFGVGGGKVVVGKVEFGDDKVLVGNEDVGGNKVIVGKEGSISIILVDESPGAVSVGTLVAVSDGALVSVSDGSKVFVGIDAVEVAVDCNFDWNIQAAEDVIKITTIINTKNARLRLR
jgi:hypothetical protein